MQTVYLELKIGHISTSSFGWIGFPKKRRLFFAVEMNPICPLWGFLPLELQFVRIPSV